MEFHFEMESILVQEDDAQLAPGVSIKDWKKTRLLFLDETNVTAGLESAVGMMRERIQSRFIGPIEKILSSDAQSGEGFAVMAVMCILVEFLEALRSGKIYRSPLSQNYMEKRAEQLGVSPVVYSQHRQPNEYRNSKDLFVRFLRKDPHFAPWFDRDLADSFYTGIRCGLLHEASTKDGWLIRRADSDNPDTIAGILQDGHNVVYRTPFFKALQKSIKSYFEAVRTGRVESEALLRVCDHLAGIPRTYYFAYGSNMSEDQMRDRTVFFHKAFPANLKGFKFAYDKLSKHGGTRANIARSNATDCVKGVLYEIDEAGLEVLRGYECGYEKISVWLSSGCGNVEAETFISESRGPGIPPEWYVQRILTGARGWGIEEAYIDEHLLA